MKKRKKAKIEVFPPVVMFCEYCGGTMHEAPRGSQTIACIGCGRVKYGEAPIMTKGKGGV